MNTTVNSLDAAVSAQVELPLPSHCPVVTCGQQVAVGQVLAESTRSNVGSLHSPVSGIVERVTGARIILTANDECAGSGEDGEPKESEPVSLGGLAGSELRAALLSLGADLPEADSGATLIVNAVDAEPEVRSREGLLQYAQDVIKTGLQALRNVYAPAQVHVAVPNGGGTIEGEDIREVSDDYPKGLDPLVALAVTGKENPPSTVVVGLETVFQLGTIMETGKPVTQVMVTVCGENRMVSVGTPVGRLVKEAGEKLEDRDRIVLGGSMRGTAALSPSQGVDKYTLSVNVVKNVNPVAEDTACVGCGACVRICPARLDPAMLSSYAEFGMYDKALEKGLDICFECGLCGFVCISRRPMLQFIRLAKSELELAAAKAAADQGEGEE